MVELHHQVDVADQWLTSFILQVSKVFIPLLGDTQNAFQVQIPDVVDLHAPGDIGIETIDTADIIGLVGGDPGDDLFLGHVVQVKRDDFERCGKDKPDNTEGNQPADQRQAFLRIGRLHGETLAQSMAGKACDAFCEEGVVCDYLIRPTRERLGR